MTDTIYFDKVATKGRPKYVFNAKGKEMVENLATILCTDEEIASVMGVTIEILQNKDNYDTFMELKKRGRDKGKSSIRRKQYEVAMKGNVSMLIWLGRNYLDQYEKIETTGDVEVREQLNRITDAMNKIRERDSGI